MTTNFNIDLWEAVLMLSSGICDLDNISECQPQSFCSELVLITTFVFIIFFLEPL